MLIAEREIRTHGPGNLLAVCWRQWRTERRLARRGVRFRDTEPARVASAYAAMSEAEFDAINGPQTWANWRTIPRALRHVPDRPLRVLDLGCGSGGSTAVLAFYCPAGSHITGYEVAEPLVACARRRSYRERLGEAARVDIGCQGVTERLRAAEGELSDGTVDLIHASGVVGHHLDRITIQPLLSELGRLLRSDGIACLDAGPTLSAPELRTLLAAAGFTFRDHCRSWFGDPTGELVFGRAKG